MRKGKIIILVICLSLLLFSCATDIGISKRTYTETQEKLRDGLTAEVVADVKNSADDYNDKVLYYMDLGLVELYDGAWTAAANDLNVADKAIDEYGVESVSENVSALLKNDYSIAYPGEKYEEILVDTFASIAYLMAGDEESAMVEVRQADIALSDFKMNAEKQQSGLEKLVLAITPDPFRYFEVESVSDFTGSAFVDYVSMIMYRGRGDLSNAEVDYRRIQSRLSDSTVVTSDEVEIPSEMARVNLISLEGLIGFKEGKSAMAVTKNVATGDNVYHVVSWPWFEPGSTKVYSVELICSNGESTTAKIIEDFNLLAKKTLAMSVRSTYLKSFYRGYTKMCAAIVAANKAYELAEKAADQAYAAATSNGNKFAVVGATIAKKAALKAADVAFDKALEEVNKTEIADTRMGQYLPSRASVAGMTLEPGVYDFEIVYTLYNGEVVRQSYPSYEVKAGKTNLILGTCAK